jgi:hypothetical protein
LGGLRKEYAKLESLDIALADNSFGLNTAKENSRSIKTARDFIEPDFLHPKSASYDLGVRANGSAHRKQKSEPMSPFCPLVDAESISTDQSLKAFKMLGICDEETASSPIDRFMNLTKKINNSLDFSGGKLKSKLVSHWRSGSELSTDPVEPSIIQDENSLPSKKRNLNFISDLSVSFKRKCRQHIIPAGLFR